jgi:helicase SWR1
VRVGRAGGGGGNASKPAEVTEEMVLEERDRLLRQKQTQLDQIFNKHDDLVRSPLASAYQSPTSARLEIRETFHMVNWKSMLGYNPVAAKTDESQVFRDVRSYSPYLDMTR